MVLQPGSEERKFRDDLVRKPGRKAVNDDDDNARDLRFDSLHGCPFALEDPRVLYITRGMPRRLLIVTTTEVADGALRDLVRGRAGDDAEMLVVAPASEISRLDWLTNAEDDARAEATSRADKTAEATPTRNIEAQVGDSDPVKAIEDALRTFPADEILVLTRPDDEAGWLEEGAGETAQARFRLPVTHITVAEDGSLAGPGGEPTR